MPESRTANDVPDHVPRDLAESGPQSTALGCNGPREARVAQHESAVVEHLATNVEQRFIDE